ncbi:disease resistance protein RPS2-like [Canna indica]|uniref:Disease resistance protein RPS2-like n=1 Tax=Canna indica TaxID=4628 RepID=A0AAQ3KN09_9LILI|nr:disease resistance protein RPS2-like [Canna indica]
MPTTIPAIFGACGCFKDCCSQSCNYAVTYKQTITNLEIKVKELNGKYKDLETKVAAAKRDDLKPLAEVLVWFESAAKLMIEAKRIIDQYKGITKCGCSLGFPVNVCSGYLLKSNATAAHTTISELCTQEFPTVAYDRQLDRVNGRVIPPAIFGMETVFQDLKQHARNDAVSITGIYGMAGVGKTVLLEKFNNDFLESEEGREDPDVVIFLELQRSHTVENIQKSLFSRLSMEWKDGLTSTERGARISRVLSGLKFVLLIDNLWETLNHKIVGIPLPQSRSKCKIIFTTRMEDVCSRMGVDKTIKVECLSEEGAWDLFKSSARMVPDNIDARILDSAKKLTMTCGGLPAALITVAQAMASKKTFREWQSIMKDSLFQLPGMEDNVLLPLKFSYDSLPGETFRTCASYFSLVAEGCWLSKYYVRELLVGEGIIDEFENLSDTINQASYFLGILTASSLIERIDGEYFRMHPMVRAMILWVACECGKKDSKWLVQDRRDLVEAPETEKWRVAERVSLGWNKIVVLPEAPPCPDLIFLHLRDNIHLKKIPNGFFSHMPCLKILDLRDTSIEELPEGIGNLVLLQFLELSHTRIRYLPRQLEALVNLRYLGLISATHLRRIPDQVISSLHQLRWLNLYNSYSTWRIGSTAEGVGLEELESLKRLKILGITICAVAALSKLCGLGRLATSTHWLQIEGCQGLTRFNIPSTNLGENMQNLLQIRLYAMSELEEVIIGGDATEGRALLSLELLRLLSLPKAKLVWKSMCLQNLVELQIEDCKEIDRLMKMEDDGIDASETITIFPRLSRILLRQLPELESLSDGNRVLAFPNLKTMEVKSCPKLKRLALVAEKLQEIKCDRAWWDELDWGDERTKFFQHLFRPFHG